MRKTKTCKQCKTEIDKKAKTCPQCSKKQPNKLKIILITLAVMAVLGAALNQGEEEQPVDTSKNKDNNPKVTDVAKKDPTPEPTEAPEPEIEYTSYTVDEMIQDLSDNALKAENKYNKKYVEITGTLSTIDSKGEYIALKPDDGFHIISVMCYLKGDEQKEQVMEMSTGDQVILRGKIKSVGEVLGYSLDISEIE